MSWSEERDATGKTYYLDHTTKKSHWTLPPAVRATLPLAAGWREAKAADGKPFYLNDRLKATQWDRPVSFSSKSGGATGAKTKTAIDKPNKPAEAAEDLSEYGFGHGGKLVEHHHAGGGAMVETLAALPSDPSLANEYAGFDADDLAAPTTRAPAAGSDDDDDDEGGYGFGGGAAVPGGNGVVPVGAKATKRSGPRPAAQPHLPLLKLATENYSDSWVNRKISDGHLQVDVSGTGIKGPSFDYPVICNGIPNTTGRSEIRAKVDGSSWCMLGVATQNASLDKIFQNNPGCYGLSIGGVGGREILCGGTRSIRKWGPNKFAVPCVVHLIVDHDEGTLAVSVDDDVGMGEDGEGTIICEGLPIGAPLSFCSASYSYDVDIKLVGPKGKTLKRIPKSARTNPGATGRSQPSQGAYFASLDLDGDGHISASELKSAHSNPANMLVVGDAGAAGSTPWATGGGGGSSSALYNVDEGQVKRNPLARSDSIVSRQRAGDWDL